MSAIRSGFVCTASAATLTAVFAASATLDTRSLPTELTAPVRACAVQPSAVRDLVTDRR